MLIGHEAIKICNKSERRVRDPGKIDSMHTQDICMLYTDIILTIASVQCYEEFLK